MDNYKSIDENNTKISKPLRISIKGKITGYVSKIGEENKKEKVQNVNKKYDLLSAMDQNNNLEDDDI